MPISSWSLTDSITWYRNKYVLKHFNGTNIQSNMTDGKNYPQVKFYKNVFYKFWKIKWFSNRQKKQKKSYCLKLRWLLSFIVMENGRKVEDRLIKDNMVVVSKKSTKAACRSWEVERICCCYVRHHTCTDYISFQRHDWLHSVHERKEISNIKQWKLRQMRTE